MNDADLPLWLSANDLARFFGVSRRTIRRYHVEGRLPPPVYLTRRTLRWHRADVVGLLRSGPLPFGFFSRRRPLFDDGEKFGVERGE